MLRRLLDRLLGRAPADDSLGARGETAAADHLRAKAGFTILARNWRNGREELDFVALDGDVLVFVEVKTRPVHALVSGYRAVDRRKKNALLRACRAYLGQLRERPRTIRFDIVAVVHRDGEIVEVQHFENVPLFPKRFGR